MDRSGTQLDDTDRAIIEQLQADGRIPYTRLGAAVGLSEAAVRQRVQRLIDAGVMQVVAVTNPLSLGYRRMAMIGVHTEGPTDDIAKTLQAMADIDYLVVTAGSFDLMCEVVVDDDGDAARPHQPHPLACPASSRTETFIYLDLVKQTFAWGAHYVNCLARHLRFALMSARECTAPPSQAGRRHVRKPCRSTVERSAVAGWP